MTGLRSTFLLVAAGASLGFLLAGPASAAAKSPAMQACSDSWAQMKADNKVPDGQTWPKFWSQCAKDYAAAHPADAAATTKAAAEPAPAEPAPTAKSTSKSATAASSKVTEPSMAAEPAAKGKSPAMAACSDQWSKLKADNKVPEGQTWPKFWSQCSKDYAAANPDTAAPAKAGKTASKTTAAAPAPATLPAAGTEGDEASVPLPEPEVAAKIDPNKTTVNKRELTPGQKAAIVRIKACGAEWQANKKAGKLPEGAKWPQYWSDCNKRLKAQGQ